MSLNIIDIKEKININKDYVRVNLLIAMGKEGDYYVTISPSILVSGYGKTEAEANDSFEENMKLFCSDLISISDEKRTIELSKLGLSNAKSQKKNFSKAYIDKNGVLQGFEPGSVKTAMVLESF
jgi:hypothetical protein